MKLNICYIGYQFSVRLRLLCGCHNFAGPISATAVNNAMLQLWPVADSISAPNKRRCLL